MDKSAFACTFGFNIVVVLCGVHDVANLNFGIDRHWNGKVATALHVLKRFVALSRFVGKCGLHALQPLTYKKHKTRTRIAMHTHFCCCARCGLVRCAVADVR